MAALRIGDEAPAFALKDQRGRTVKLSDFAGRKLLVFFYPKADTPACTRQACAVRDARKDLRTLGVAAVGISPDAPGEQRSFDRKFGLGFPLLADPGHAVADAWGVWGKKSMYGRAYDGILRSAFLVDEDGRIAGAWVRVTPARTVPYVMERLAPKGSGTSRAPSRPASRRA